MPRRTRRRMAGFDHRRLHLLPFLQPRGRVYGIFFGKIMAFVYFSCFLLAHIYVATTNSCFKDTCVCSNDFSRVSCVNANLKTIDSICQVSHVRKLNQCALIKTLLLRENYITEIDVDDVLQSMPRLKVLDLRSQKVELCGPQMEIEIKGVRIFFSSVCNSDRMEPPGWSTSDLATPLPPRSSSTQQITTVTVNVLIWSSVTAMTQTIMPHEHDSLGMKILKVSPPQ